MPHRAKAQRATLRGLLPQRASRPPTQRQRLPVLRLARMRQNRRAESTSETPAKPDATAAGAETKSDATATGTETKSDATDAAKTDDSQKSSDSKKESTSKKKKGLCKIVPW